MISTNNEITEPVELDSEQYDEHLLITREFTHVNFSDHDLHRLGYYWTMQVAALPLVK